MPDRTFVHTKPKLISNGVTHNRFALTLHTPEADGKGSYGFSLERQSDHNGNEWQNRPENLLSIWATSKFSFHYEEIFYDCQYLLSLGLGFLMINADLGWLKIRKF
jgi:hypothetical protein